MVRFGLYLLLGGFRPVKRACTHGLLLCEGVWLLYLSWDCGLRVEVQNYPLGVNSITLELTHDAPVSRVPTIDEAPHCWRNGFKVKMFYDVLLQVHAPSIIQEASKKRRDETLTHYER